LEGGRYGQPEEVVADALGQLYNDQLKAETVVAVMAMATATVTTTSGGGGRQQQRQRRWQQQWR